MATCPIDLPEHVVEVAREEARRREVPLEQLITTCLEQRLGPGGEETSHQSGRSIRTEDPAGAGVFGVFTFSFVRRLSHEVRTAVTSILGFAEILETEVDIPQKELVEIVRRGGARLLQTIDAVMYLARLENDSVELSPEPLDVGLQVQAVVDSYREQAEAKDLLLVVEQPPGHLYLNVDPDAFTRILRALVENAIKFTDNGKVTVHLRQEDGGAVLTVEDTGCGISAREAAAVFEPFSQRGASKKDVVAGSGLGLTVTRALVEFLGGTISCKSVPGKGSSFSVQFPARLLESSATDRLQERSHQWGLDQLPPDQRVLLVEDDPATRELVREMLPGSYIVKALSDVSSALEEANARCYDIVLMDINLKDRIDGTQLMKQMRQIDGYEEALFIAVTAYEKTADGESFHEKGFDGHVGKPFTKKALYENLIQV